jgi:capsular exopolysaccharide synthesis family protein
LFQFKKNRYDSFASVKEMLFKLKINLNYIDIDKKYKCIMITSAMPSEGKSFVSANLAVSMASEGLRVLLIDADMRSPSLHHFFTLENRNGLSTCIAEGANFEKCLNQIGDKSLFVLAAGRTPPSPALMLSSSQMGNLLESMRAKFDMIIIDTAPVLAVPDSVALSQYVDGALLVVRWGKTTKQAVLETVHQLKMMKAPLIGSVLNDVRPMGGHYRYGYH